MTKTIGRPSKIDQIDMRQLEFVCKKGFTDEEIAHLFNIAKSTLNKYKKEIKEFSDSLKDWKDEADAKVERSLYESAMGFTCKNTKAVVVSDGKEMGSHVEMVEELIQCPPNATSMIFWLKNRKPNEWRDKHDIIIEDNRHPENEGMSVADLLKEAEEIANRLVKGRKTLTNN